MPAAQNGDRVRVHYTGKLTDGSEFDTSRDRDPLEFTLGGHEVIAGFEAAVVGMEPGQTKTVTVPSEDAYGAYDDSQVLSVERDRIPDTIQPEVGDQLQLRQPDESVVVVTVREITEETVVLDANHPLAGKDLVFDIELVEIV